jgi:hypothetical protein
MLFDMAARLRKPTDDFSDGTRTAAEKKKRGMCVQEEERDHKPGN